MCLDLGEISNKSSALYLIVTHGNMQTETCQLYKPEPADPENNLQLTVSQQISTVYRPSLQNRYSVFTTSVGIHFRAWKWARTLDTFRIENRSPVSRSQCVKDASKPSETLARWTVAAEQAKGIQRNLEESCGSPTISLDSFSLMTKRNIQVSEYKTNTEKE